MSKYVTRKEMQEFVFNELAKALSGLTQAIETRGTTTARALHLAVVAETMAFVSLRCQKDRAQGISQLEAMMEGQEVGLRSRPLDYRHQTHLDQCSICRKLSIDILHDQF